MAERKDIRWTPPEALTSSELKICKLCKRSGRLFPFLRRRRLELFDESLQAELSEMYKDTPKGRPPLPAAMLGMVTLLQAYQGVSDAEAVTRVACDRRWQMVLDCDGAEEAPF